MKVIRNILIIILIILVFIFLASFGIVAIRTADTEIKYQDIISKYCDKYNSDPIMIASIIHVESGFDPKAVSKMDARGLMQVLPETAEWVADDLGIEYSEEMLFDPDYNINIGVYYYEYLYDYYSDEKLALAAYNGGMGNVDEWLKNPEYSKDGRNLDYIPFEETRNYLDKVLNTYKTYDFFYGDGLPADMTTMELAWRNYKIFLKDIVKSF